MEMIKRGGFRLCKFLSNCLSVTEALSESEVSPKATVQNGAEENMEMALGILWETISDVFTFVFKFSPSPPTKKGILATSASLFDPLGLVAPFLLLAKLILQVLWRMSMVGMMSWER